MNGSQAFEGAVLIEAGEAVIEVELCGERGPLACILPGLGGGIERFRDLARRLADRGIRSAAINPRGAGASMGPLEDLTLHTLACDVAHVIEALAPDATLVGNAFGGRLARCVAADHPQLVSRLVLVGAGGKVGPDPEALAAMQRFLDESLPEDVRREAAGTAFFAPGNPVPDLFLHDNRTHIAAEAQIAALSRTNPDDWWAGGGQPILVIQGLQDRIAPPRNAYLLHEQLGGLVQLRLIDGAGHAVLNERPAEVADAIASAVAH